MFGDAALPSLVALEHLDVKASLLYEFCVRFLNLRGGEMRDAVEEQDQRQARREERRTENRARAENKSRSRSDRRK